MEMINISVAGTAATAPAATYSREKDYTLQFEFDNAWMHAPCKMAVVNGKHRVPIINGQCTLPKVSDESDVTISIRAIGMATAQPVVLTGARKPAEQPGAGGGSGGGGALLVTFEIDNNDCDPVGQANVTYEEITAAFAAGRPVMVMIYQAPYWEHASSIGDFSKEDDYDGAIIVYRYDEKSVSSCREYRIYPDNHIERHVEEN